MPGRAYVLIKVTCGGQELCRPNQVIITYIQYLHQCAEGCGGRGAVPVRFQLRLCPAQIVEDHLGVRHVQGGLDRGRFGAG